MRALSFGLSCLLVSSPCLCWSRVGTRVGGTMTVEEYSYWSSYPIVIVAPCLDCAIKLLACDCHMIFLIPDLPFNISEAKWMVNVQGLFIFNIVFLTKNERF